MTKKQREWAEIEARSKVLDVAEKASQHYERLLGLQSPWHVKEVREDAERKTVLLCVGHDRGAKFECGQCGKLCKLHDHDELRNWRHRDATDWQCEIVTREPRVKCPDHGVRVARLPWAETHSHYTRSFEQEVIDTLKTGASVEATAELFDLRWNGVQGIVNRAVSRGVARRDSQTEIKAIG